MSLPALLLLVMGALLIWAAIQDRDPVQEIKNALTSGKKGK